MTFHSGGANRTLRERRAVNHVYSLPFIKQQVCLQAEFGPRDLPPKTRRLLDFDNNSAENVGAYLARRRGKATIAK